MNRKQALEAIAFNDGGYLASGQTTHAGVLCYAAQTHMEAQRWVNFNRAYFVPGSDKIERFDSCMDAEAEL